MWADQVGAGEVAPSVYAADLSRLGAQLQAVLDAGARILHFDIGDGRFIDEITIGPVVLRSVAAQVHAAGGWFDCHLMVAEPERQLEHVKAAGGDSITFHVEASDHPGRVIEAARDLGLGVGVAIDPETPIDGALDLTDRVDVVLCMSIHPGLSGQGFLPTSIQRIAELRRRLPGSVVLEVDGGIHLETIRVVRDAGADVLVSGSGVFWAEDPGAAFEQLQAISRPAPTATPA